MTLSEITFSAIYLYFTGIFLWRFKVNKEAHVNQILCYYMGGMLGFIVAISPLWSPYFQNESVFFLVILTLSGFFMGNRMSHVFKHNFFVAKSNKVCLKELREKQNMWRLTKIITIAFFLSSVLVIVVIIQNISRLHLDLRTW